MACHCPFIKCFDYDEYGHVAADCPEKSHCQLHLQGTEIPILTQDTMIDPHLAMIIETGTLTMVIETDIDITGQDPIPTVIDTGVTVGVIHKGVTPGHITNSHTTAHHTTETHRHITIDETPHIEDPHHTEVFSRDCSRYRPHTSHKNNCITSSKPSYSSNRTAWKNKDRKYKQVTIDDLPSKYYSSDEPSSKSHDDLN